jgi:glyceraldehyde-3-phosphate dehydrogenase/erythrose-4-phosphate dehydrogenase
VLIASLDVVLTFLALHLFLVRYLWKFDTVYGRWARDVRTHDGRLQIDGTADPILSETDPAKLP